MIIFLGVLRPIIQITKVIGKGWQLARHGAFFFPMSEMDDNADADQPRRREEGSGPLLHSVKGQPSVAFLTASSAEHWPPETLITSVCADDYLVVRAKMGVRRRVRLQEEVEELLFSQQPLSEVVVWGVLSTSEVSHR